MTAWREPGSRGDSQADPWLDIVPFSLWCHRQRALVVRVEALLGYSRRAARPAGK